MTPPETEVRRKQLLDAFRMPAVQTMVSRKSSITNAFVNAIIPVIQPTADEIEQALTNLEMAVPDVLCAYCGNPSTEWDHLRPLVMKSRPTGYISEIANLVPACGKCNQSKGNKPWRQWMLSETGQHSPTVRRIANLPARIARLEAFESWRTPMKIDFAQALGEQVWSEYWKMWTELNAELQKCQTVANRLRERIRLSIQSQA